ncbi:hypothetical protein ACHBTE_02440 [Streptomyces sp. M41]|uniref:hypothetical protein n=1 Tax=Streptomyces sp. M41 TaxID=3059412 RepID=UPI00374CA5BD
MRAPVRETPAEAVTAGRARPRPGRDLALLDAPSETRLEHSPGEGWSFRELARHLAESTCYADAVGAQP